MRNAIITACSMGAAALILSGTAAAQNLSTGISGTNDIQFGAVNGCGATAGILTCVDDISDGTFSMRTVTTDKGTFVQTLIDEVGAGTVPSFKSEDWVQIGGPGGGQTASNNGIASHQKLNVGAFDGTGLTIGDQFETESVIKGGFAAPITTGPNAGNTDIYIGMGVSSNAGTGNTGDAFATQFAFTLDQNLNKTTSMNQLTGFTDLGDKQRFVTEIKNAAAGGTLTLGTAPVGGTTTYNAGDVIQALWVGQDVSNGTGANDAIAGKFATETQGIVGGTTLAAQNFTSEQPIDWDNNGGTDAGVFGTTPTF